MAPTDEPADSTDAGASGRSMAATAGAGPNGPGADPHRSLRGRIEPLPADLLRTKRVLADAARRLVEAVAHVDLARTDEATLERAAASVGALADELATVPSLAEKGGPFFSGDVQALITHRSGIAGALNPLAPPLSLWRSGERTFGSVTFGSAYEGPPGFVHGGFIAAAFDELLTSAQLASGIGGYTGTLTVRMRAPMPLRVPVDLEAWVGGVDGRKITALGEARVEGELVAEGEIICIAARRSDGAATRTAGD